ncbi:hypothetical protein GMA8713_04110 [Grimontia marina]|uniref:Uncharacterized protein n=1 Tax=Grimontia marina TaxID=646534 RepID=A0A128FH02_9GAMM|nr:hypothetical protein GMA8713_04110 [Grimontia marina]
MLESSVEVGDIEKPIMCPNSPMLYRLFHVYKKNLTMLEFIGHQCVQFEASFTRKSRSISVEFKEEVSAFAKTKTNYSTV